MKLLKRLTAKQIIYFLIVILTLVGLLLQVPFVKKQLSKKQTRIVEPLQETTEYYEVDSSRTWPIGNTVAAQSKFDRDIAKEIRKGGFILVFRHAHREKMIDVTKYDALELLTQVDGATTFYKNAVCLSETQGVIQARAMGEYFKLASIPVGHVISSPSCRSRQTAKYAFSKIDQIETRLLHFYGEPYGPFDSDSVAVHFSEVKKLLVSAAPSVGTNTVVSAHNNTIRAFMIDDVFDPNSTILRNVDFTLEEGGFHVLKVENGKLLFVTKFNNFSGFSNKLFDRPKKYIAN